MKPSSSLRALGLAVGIAGMTAVGFADTKDLWIHPRGESFDAKRHYVAPGGELYYKAENDIEDALGDISVERIASPLITVKVGADLIRSAEASGGALLPVLLWDSNGDGQVNRSVHGRLDGQKAIFDSPALSDLNLRANRWQIGVKFVANGGKTSDLDGRYLASVDSGHAKVAYHRIRQLAAVAAGPVSSVGLVIRKHREGIPFDFATFVNDPARYVEDFEVLTRTADGDDWTVNGDGRSGKLVSHFEREDLFIVSTAAGAELDVTWGDMPLLAYLEDRLAAAPDTDGCYSSLGTQLENDGSRVTVPHRLMYCPDDAVALFDAPDGYQIGLTARRDQKMVERTEVGTSISDNFRLYAKEVYPRRPSSRSTGSVSGNIRAGLDDAGADLKDALRHAITGSRPINIHTGQRSYRASPLTAIPRALRSLTRLHPLEAVGELATGVDSTVRIGASAVSALDNSVLNPVLQLTVGTFVSPEAADSTGDWIGAVTQAAAKNLPGGERSLDAFSPVTAWRHNRAFEPIDYTRTDVQLNIDRFMSTLDTAVIRAIDRHNDDSGSGTGGSAQEPEEASGGGAGEPSVSPSEIPTPGCGMGKGRHGKHLKGRGLHLKVRAGHGKKAGHHVLERIHDGSDEIHIDIKVKHARGGFTHVVKKLTGDEHSIRVRVFTKGVNLFKKHILRH